MYKMIVVDLDGTLLNDYKEVSKENIEMIQKAYKEKGIFTVIATGRPLLYAKDISLRYGDCFANYIIACDGAIIKSIKEEEYIYKTTFSNKEILEVRRIFLEEKADYLMLYTEEESIIEISNKVDEKRAKGMTQNKMQVKDIKNVIEKDELLDKYLCIIGASEENLKKIIKRLQKLKDLEDSVICSYLDKSTGTVFESKYIDIVKRGCTKKNAINVLAEKLGVKQEEIIVMGDGGNDIPMFEVAGLKIAMENAEECIKEKADYITTSNNENGVAKAIKRFIFDEEDKI